MKATARKSTGYSSTVVVTRQKSLSMSVPATPVSESVQDGQSAVSNKEPQSDSPPEEQMFDGKQNHGESIHQLSRHNSESSDGPPPGVHDFEMDFHLESGEDISFDNEHDPLPPPLEYSLNYGEHCFGDDELIDYGMYTRALENGVCHFCHEQFDSKAGLMVHKTCFFIRKGVEAINSGRQPYDGDRYSFVCEDESCDQILMDLPSLKIHMMNHWGGQFECKECNYKSPAETHMRQHLITHTGEKPYKCNYCDKAFTQSHSLKTHIESAHLQSKFKCRDDSCGQQFTTPNSMKAHFKNYHGMSAYSLNQLPPPMITNYHDIHPAPLMQTHTTTSGYQTSGDYVCTFPGCDRSFGSEKNRLIHTTKKHPGFKAKAD